jgi:hypothetical protein
VHGELGGLLSTRSNKASNALKEVQANFHSLAHDGYSSSNFAIQYKGLCAIDLQRFARFRHFLSLSYGCHYFLSQQGP